MTIAGDSVTLTDLQVIQRWSLAVRQGSADRAELVEALRADLAWLESGRRAASVEDADLDDEVEDEKADAAPVRRAPRAPARSASPSSARKATAAKSSRTKAKKTASTRSTSTRRSR